MVMLTWSRRRSSSGVQSLPLLAMIFIFREMFSSLSFSWNIVTLFRLILNYVFYENIVRNISMIFVLLMKATL